VSDSHGLIRVQVRTATSSEAPALEAVQRRASAVWDEYRERLAAHPEAIELPHAFIENGWVRVAAGSDGAPIGFSVVLPGGDRVDELDGLFVEPAHMGRGVGRALVEDALRRAGARGTVAIEVTAGPARGFYERLQFRTIGSAVTAFGPAVRMRLLLG
jgi:GNAT superfamily N-acetyltransferase